MSPVTIQNFLMREFRSLIKKKNKGPAWEGLQDAHTWTCFSLWCDNFSCCLKSKEVPCPFTILHVTLNVLYLMQMPFFSVPISYRWHFQPVPTQTQSRSIPICPVGRNNLKCCGLWAQCWQWSSSSSLSLPSCSLRSKSLCSVSFLCVYEALNCSGSQL